MEQHGITQDMHKYCQSSTFHLSNFPLTFTPEDWYYNYLATQNCQLNGPRFITAYNKTFSMGYIVHFEIAPSSTARHE